MSAVLSLLVCVVLRSGILARPLGLDSAILLLGGVLEGFVVRGTAMAEFHHFFVQS